MHEYLISIKVGKAFEIIYITDSDPGFQYVKFKFRSIALCNSEYGKPNEKEKPQKVLVPKIHLGEKRE